MAYDVYLKNLLLPITPESIKIHKPNDNQRINLIDGEYTVIKNHGLNEISFECLIPNMEYPFARYIDGFKPPKYFIEQLRNIKEKKEAIYLIINRKTPTGEYFWSEKFLVTLENLDITESANYGFDIMVSISLKGFEELQTTLINKNNEIVYSRNDSTSPKPSSDITYVVKKGDTLWGIAKKYYGDGSKYIKIFEANKSKIEKANLIYVGQILVIPA